jgi:4-amino-4-deoxy-L-arabinose transferase-like glycosyltransferase
MRWISAALLLASLLIGLAHVAGLPPLEGFDQTAHYSYIEQIAKTGTLPRFGDTMRQDVQDAVDFFVSFAAPGDWTSQYHKLLTADAETIERVRRIVNAPRDPPPAGEPGRFGNWEVQHPPFYYALLTPAYLLSERWSLAGQVALLRGLSYFMAWLSLCLAVFAAAKAFPTSDTGRAMIAAPALWPFIFPGWFPEMARLGNDSLVALLVACAVAVVACAPNRRWSWFLLGVICGLGALTKVTFLPFLAVITILLLYRTWRRDALPWHFLGFLITVIAVAGWWYVQRSVETGMLLPLDGGLVLSEKGGLIAGVMRHFSVGGLARVILEAERSFLWSGSWSPSFVILAPLVAMSLLIGFSYLYGLRSYLMYPLVQITLLTLGFWALATIYPTLVFIGLGYFDFPGYYLHSFAPALAPVIAIAIATANRNWLARTAIWLLLAYNVVFLFGTTFMLFLYFAGCNTRFTVASASACWNDRQRLIETLDVLAYPLAACWLAAGGAIVLCWGAALSLALANRQPRISRAIEHGASASL